MTPGRRRRLHEALLKKEERLARMYHGAMVVLDDLNNPDRLALAAHDLRELMEKIPRVLDVPLATQRQGGLKEKCLELMDRWRRAEKNSKCNGDDGWQGDIDGHLHKFLIKLAEFFSWFEKDYPTRNEEARQALRALDGAPYPLPAELERPRVSQWREIEIYFTQISHHKSPESEEEFVTNVDDLERILLNRMQPSTFDDFDTLDKIIERGEQSAE